MKKSLCIDARMWLFSGIGTYLQHLIPRIATLYDWDLTLLIRKQDSELFKTLPNVKKIATKAAMYTVQEQLFLSYEIPRCDLFWSPHYTIPIFPIRALKRAVTIHDVCHIAQVECFSKVKRKAAHFLLSQAIKKSDLIFTISAFSQKEIFKFFPQSKEIHVASCATPVIHSESFPHLASLGVDYPFILYVGNIKPHKNIQRLLEAFKRVSDKKVHLILAGNVSMPLEDLDPRVHVKEGLSNQELQTLYSHAKLLIQPSLYEGFGLTPLEAMSFGCPVVSSHAASLPEVCGDAVEYVDPLNIDSMTFGMNLVLQNVQVKATLIQKGYERIKQFSWEDSAKKIVELFLKELSI